MMCILAASGRAFVWALPRDVLVARRADLLSDRSLVYREVGLTKYGFVVGKSHQLNLATVPWNANAPKWIGWQGLGFDIYSGRSYSATYRSTPTVTITWQPFEGYRVVVPYWPVILLSLPLTVAGINRLLKRLARPSAGICRICGYDLRATPEDQSRYPLNYASRIRTDRGH